MKKGGKEERREGGKEGRKEGRREGRKEGRKEGRREGGKEERREGGKEKRREGRKEGRKKGGKEERREGGKEGRKEGGKEGRRKGGKEERREGRREGGKDARGERREGRKEGRKEGPCVQSTLAACSHHGQRAKCCWAARAEGFPKLFSGLVRASFWHRFWPRSEPVAEILSWDASQSHIDLWPKHTKTYMNHALTFCFETCAYVLLSWYALRGEALCPPPCTPPPAFIFKPAPLGKGIVGSKGNRFKNKSWWGGAGGRAQRLPPQCVPREKHIGTSLNGYIASKNEKIKKEAHRHKSWWISTKMKLTQIDDDAYAKRKE